MRTNITEFKCDECGKKIVKEYGIGFPYKEGWLYLYNFEFKSTSLNRAPIMDKHFCSEKCIHNFINKYIKEQVKEISIKRKDLK